MPFAILESRVASLFELAHYDVWGPYQNETHDEKTYFLTLDDGISRVTWIYLIVNKSDVVVGLKEFIALIHNQFNMEIKKIKQENGWDFFNDYLISLFKEMGIIHHSTCPYTLQQNVTKT